MAVSQSDTKWFKKGSKLPDGTIAKKSLVWNTKTGKRVQGKVNISTTSGSVKKGTTVKYKAGTNKGVVKKKPSFAGGGVMPGKPKAATTRPKPSGSGSGSGGGGGRSGSGGGTGGGKTGQKKTGQKRTAVVTRGDGSKTKITTTKYNKSGDRGALAPRPGEYQAGRGQVAASARRAAAAKKAAASGQVPAAKRSYANGARSGGSASRGKALGLNPATGGSRSNPSPYVNSSSQNQRNAGKPPMSKAGGSKNKRGGERRTAAAQARDATRRAVKKLNR
jgi:hypothetical protein